MKRISLLLSFIIFSLLAFAQEKARPAKEILDTAYKQAQEQNKKVLVIFHASWCGWCKKMDASLNSPECKKMFDDNYVIVHLTVHETDARKKEENPGADEILKKQNAFDEGIPFWLVYDKDGNLLADSFIKSGDGKQANIGCPASEKEVATFVQILKATSSLADKELAIITTEFRKNDTH